jgi:amino acid transporter
MNISQIYIAVAIVILAVIAFLVFYASKQKPANRLTPLAGLAFGFVLAGMGFGENRFIGYGLMGIGVAFAILDMYQKGKKDF